MTEEQPKDRLAGHAVKGMRMAENAVYVAAGLLLFAGAIAVVVMLGYHLVRDIGKGTKDAITATLDGLLLVFILLELLAAVRATMIERTLVAEPFLVVGIIASIKEIVILALTAKEELGNGEKFDDAMTEIGVLGGIILLLALASYLVRLKEREPEEDEEEDLEES